MQRKRIYELAKEWGATSQAILDRLRKIGSTATTARSTITDDEAAKVKALLGIPLPPLPVVGQQRLVFERVVTHPTDGTTAAITTREQVVERRIQTGVIRRRTTRVEVPQELAAVVNEKPTPPVTPIQAAPTPREETLPIAFEVPARDEEIVPLAVSMDENVVVRAVTVDTKPQQDAVQAPSFTHPVVADMAKSSPRVLGRIELCKPVQVRKPTQRPAPIQPAPVTTQRQKPAPVTPLSKKPAPVTPLEIRKPQRPRSVVVHTPTVTKRDAGEARFLRGFQKHKRPIGRPVQAPALTIPKASKRVIKVAEVITVADLAKEMGIKATEVIAKLFGLGVMATINHVLDVDTATLAASEFGYTVENVTLDVEALLTPDMASPAPKALTARPPVVTVMGHVDHGKTSGGALQVMLHTW